MPASPDLRRLTVAEYYAMADAGILTADDRVELLDGELVPMSPVGDWHYGTANWLNNGLAPPGLQHRATVAVQGPVRLDDHTEPQPDIALLRFRVDFCRFGKPTPADVLLFIEYPTLPWPTTGVPSWRLTPAPASLKSGLSTCPTAALKPIPNPPAASTPSSATTPLATAFRPGLSRTLRWQLTGLSPPNPGMML